MQRRRVELLLLSLMGGIVALNVALTFRFFDLTFKKHPAADAARKKRNKTGTKTAPVSGKNESLLPADAVFLFWKKLKKQSAAYFRPISVR